MAATLASPANGNTTRWYVHVGGENFGPYGRPDIERMIQNRQVRAQDYLCPEGGAEWIEARRDPTFGHLLSEHVDFAAILPDPSATKSAAGIKVYNGKSGAQGRLALLAFVMGSFGLVSLKPIFDWLSGGPRPEGGILLAATSLLFLPFGVLFLSNALRGLPRLTVTPEGIKFEDGIRTKRATWDSVGPFAVKDVYSGRSKPTRMAYAKIAGSAAGRSTFTISDHFPEPIDAIATELNAARELATGESAVAIEDSKAKEASLGLAQFKIPWLTLSLLFVLIVVFTLENTFAVTPSGRGLSPSIETLVAFGALSHRLIISYGEWYRLFTSPLLHANLAHIAGNGVALVWGGWLLERLVGRLWFFAFFSIGALGGSLVSLAVNPVNLVSVGASGALMGLFAALFVGGFRYASGTAARTRLQLNSLRILIPSLLPFLQTSAMVGRIDYGAHIGGTLSGAALALVLLKGWPEGARIPQFRKAAASVSAIGALLFAASGGLAIANYPKFVQAAQHAQSAAPPPPLQPGQPAGPSAPADILSDHGPKRAACDVKWGTLHLQDSDYPAFLQKCMNESSTNP